MSDEAHSVRLDRVETEVGAIRSEMGGLKTEMGRVQADVKGLGAILTRIEQGVSRAQDQQDQRDERSRHSPVAIATVLVTVMSMMVGGAWVIGSQTARTEVRLNDQDTQMGRLLLMRDREIDGINHRIERLEENGGRRGGESGKADQ